MKHNGGRMAFFSGGGAASSFPNYSAYSCSKVGVVRLVENLAIELAPYEIELNCIAPGFVVTRLHEQTLAAGPERVGAEFFSQTRDKLENGGAISPEVGAHCAAFLISDNAKGITGRFVAAPYDGYTDWVDHLDRIRKSDLFTLRRIVPKDRGENWQ
jgi:NAD(P)-dependent dehydrogenase (short-subunit alcohol dehydrogenase family)